jgi:hypothetical protein
MSADNDDSDSSDAEEKKPYGFIGRLLLFLFIAGPTSVFAFGLWSRVGIGASTKAAATGGDSLSLGFILWLLGMIGSAIAIFKR